MSITRLIIITTINLSVYSRFTSRKGNDLATYNQNRDSHFEFLEKHTDKCCFEMSNTTDLIGACKDTPWLQVACTISFSNPTIIGIYEAAKNHLIFHVLYNTISGHSGDSIGQVATNPSEMSKSDWGAHVSDMNNNDLLGNMP